MTSLIRRGPVQDRSSWPSRAFAKACGGTAWTEHSHKKWTERWGLDNDDNRLTKWGTPTLTYDANGNIKTDGTNTYTFDDRNHMASITGGITATFVYDGLGRRMKKTISGATTQFLYDGVNPVQELSGTGTPTANLLTGLGPDDRYTRTETSSTRDYFTDALGSTLALTDSAGTVQTSYSYEPFGKVSTSGASTTNPYAFTGRETDGVGLTNERARYFSPSYGRFLSEDPVGLDGGDVNFYTYVGNNSVDLVDPDGLAPNICGSAFWLICRAVGKGLRAAAGGGEAVANALEALERPFTPQMPFDQDPLRHDPRKDPPGDPLRWRPKGPGWQWRPPGSQPGVDPGSWYNPLTGQRFYPHFDPSGHGAHWDYNDGEGQCWRIYPDGRWESKPC